MNFVVEGVDAALKHITDYATSVQRRADRVTEALTFMGEDKANEGFAEALYAGANDVTVFTEKGIDSHDVVAEGKDVLFLEFGAGVAYADHPLAAELNLKHGTYRTGSRGATGKPWAYYGEPGNIGSVLRESAKGTVSITDGQPPSEAMYTAAKFMREHIPIIASEEWKE